MWEFGVRISHVGLREQIDIVEDEDVVTRRMLLGSFQCKVESDVEEFASVEFSIVVGLLDDVYVIIFDFVGVN